MDASQSSQKSSERRSGRKIMKPQRYRNSSESEDSLPDIPRYLPLPRTAGTGVLQNLERDMFDSDSESSSDLRARLQRLRSESPQSPAYSRSRTPSPSSPSLGPMQSLAHQHPWSHPAQGAPTSQRIDNDGCEGMKSREEKENTSCSPGFDQTSQLSPGVLNPPDNIRTVPSPSITPPPPSQTSQPSLQLDSHRSLDISSCDLTPRSDKEYVANLDHVESSSSCSSKWSPIKSRKTKRGAQRKYFSTEQAIEGGRGESYKEVILEEAHGYVLSAQVRVKNIVLREVWRGVKARYPGSFPDKPLDACSKIIKNCIQAWIRNFKAKEKKVGGSGSSGPPLTARETLVRTILEIDRSCIPGKSKKKGKSAFRPGDRRVQSRAVCKNTASYKPPSKAPLLHSVMSMSQHPSTSHTPVMPHNRTRSDRDYQTPVPNLPSGPAPLLVLEVTQNSVTAQEAREIAVPEQGSREATSPPQESSQNQLLGQTGLASVLDQESRRETFRPPFIDRESRRVPVQDQVLSREPSQNPGSSQSTRSDLRVEEGGRADNTRFNSPTEREEMRNILGLNQPTADQANQYRLTRVPRRNMGETVRECSLSEQGPARRRASDAVVEAANVARDVLNRNSERSREAGSGISALVGHTIDRSLVEWEQEKERLKDEREEKRLERQREWEDRKHHDLMMITALRSAPVQQTQTSVVHQASPVIQRAPLHSVTFVEETEDSSQPFPVRVELSDLDHVKRQLESVTENKFSAIVAGNPPAIITDVCQLQFSPGSVVKFRLKTKKGKTYCSLG